MVGELHGKVALVTGGATGIGRATALALAEAGANVLVHYSKSTSSTRSTRTPIARSTLARTLSIGTARST